MTTTHADPVRDQDAAARRRSVVVLLLLFATGWAANHFAALIPVFRDTENFSSAVVDGAFGVYAVGLLPGLLGGGGLSDRVGRRPIVLTGASIAAAGNLLMLFWHPEAGVYVGRLVVGLGAGLAISAGTAWAADLGGRKGTTMAGVLLTSGFATGPLVSGLVAQFLPSSAALDVPFVVTVLLSVAVTGLAALVLAEPSTHGGAGAAPAAVAPAGRRRGLGIALLASIPMALWVFSSVTTAIIVMAARMSGRYEGPWLPGVAAAVALGTGVLIQVVARRYGWGPWTGVAGAALAATGFVLTIAAGAAPSLLTFFAIAVVLGGAYGLCLREGLLDVETLAPARTRGTAIGIFYVGTYLGFGLPVLLETIRPAVGTTTPMLVLAALALTAAVARSVHIRTTDHLDR